MIIYIRNVIHLVKNVLNLEMKKIIIAKNANQIIDSLMNHSLLLIIVMKNVLIILILLEKISTTALHLVALTDIIKLLGLKKNVLMFAKTIINIFMNIMTNVLKIAQKIKKYILKKINV